MNIDQLSPAFIGEDVFKLSVDPALPVPRVLVPVQVNVDYSGADEHGGPVAPIEFLVTPPRGGNAVSRIMRAKPSPSLLFVPSVPGQHLVIVRELAHNRFFGRLLVDVAGELA